MIKLAVIGKDVSQSTSPQMHTFIAENLGKKITYDAVSVPEDQFEEKLPEILAEYKGFNVTIPYKLSVIPSLKKLDGDAAAFGAVNTVMSKKLTGYNTDGLGFMLMLASNGVKVKGKKILLIGAGGAGRSVAKKLTEAGASVFVCDKMFKFANRLAQDIEGVTPLKEAEPDDYYAVINASGVGMHKTKGISPVSAEVIEPCEVAVDLIYVPAKSQFLRIAENLGKKIINGKAMLFYQAYYSDCIFFGMDPSESQAKALYKKYLKVTGV